MLKKRRVVITILIIALFGLFKTIKSFNSAQPEKLDNLSGADISQVDVRAYSTTIKNKKAQESDHISKIKTMKQKYSNMAMIHPPADKGEHNFGHANKKKTTKGDKKKKKVAKKDNIKKNKKKKIAKKKAKKKKVEEELEDNNETEEDEDNNPVATAPVTEVIITNIANKKEDDNKLSRTLEEWEELLINNGPNMDELKKFNDLYQVGIVSDDTFYRILNKMLSEKNQEFQRNSLWAADLNPNLQSFLLLIRAVQENSYNSDIRTTAESKLNKYESLSQVKTLQMVLRTQQQSETAFQLAANIVKNSADKYLKNDNDTSNDDKNTGLSDQENSSNPNDKYFTGIIRELEIIVQTSQDSGIQDISNSTLEHLNDLIPPSDAA